MTTPKQVLVDVADLEMSLILSCAGVIVDAETHTVHAHGRLLPVTGLAYSPGSEERPGTERVDMPEKEEVVRLIYKTPERIAAAIARPIQATAASCHFNVVCENGWWVEVTLWPEDGTLSYQDPRQSAWDAPETDDATDMLRFFDEVGARPMFVPTQEEVDGYCADPWCGLHPGEWMTDSEWEDPRTIYTKVETERHD